MNNPHRSNNTLCILFREFLYERKLKAYVFNKLSGDIKPIPQLFWGSVYANTILPSGYIASRDGQDFHKDVLIKQADFREFLANFSKLQAKASEARLIYSDPTTIEPQPTKLQLIEPQPCNRGGRPSEYDTEAFLLEAMRLLWQGGEKWRGGKRGRQAAL